MGLVNAEHSPPDAGAEAERPVLLSDRLAEFTPKLTEVLRSVVFGDIWQRTAITPRERSLITVAALLALGRKDELRKHMRRGKANGITQEEMAELVTHLAFYSGIPAAISAAVVAYDVYEVNGGGLEQWAAEMEKRAAGPS